MRARSIAASAFHGPSASSAASIARRTSSAVALTAVPTTAPVAGLVTSKRPPSLSPHSPPIGI